MVGSTRYPFPKGPGAWKKQGAGSRAEGGNTNSFVLARGSVSTTVGTAFTSNTVNLPVTPDGTPWPNGTLALMFGIDGPSTMTPGAGWTALQSPTANTFLAYKFLNGTETTAPYTRAAETALDTVHISIIGNTTFQAPEATTALTDPAAITPSWGGNAGTMFFVFATGAAGATSISGVPTGFDEPKRNFEAYVNDAEIIFEVSKNGDTSTTLNPSTFTHTGTLRTYTIAVRDALNDGMVFTQPTATFDTAHDGDPVVEEGFDYSGFFGLPFQDAPPDETVQFFNFIDQSFDIEESDWTPDWAQAPPTDLTDELAGDRFNRTSLEIWTDEDEPISDGSFSAPPDANHDAPLAPLLGEVFDDDEPIVEFWLQVVVTDQFDETGETTGGSSSLDWVDEDEPAADDWFQAPAEDAPVAALDDDITDTLFGEVFDEDEPEADDWVFSPFEDAPVALNDDITSTLFGEVFDDDEPVTDGWLVVVPTDLFDETGQTKGQTSNNDWVEEDEPITDGWVGLVPTTQFDETGETSGGRSNNDWTDEDEPVADGWFAVVPTDLFDETGETTGGSSNLDWTEEDEPVAEGHLWAQYDEALFVNADDISQVSFADVWDDDEPITDGWIQFQPDETLFVADPTILAQETGPVYDDDEPDVETFSTAPASPLEDTPEVVVGTPGGYPWYEDGLKRKKKLVIPHPEMEEEKVLPPPAARRPSKTLKANFKAAEIVLAATPKVALPPVLVNVTVAPTTAQFTAALFNGVVKAESEAEKVIQTLLSEALVEHESLETEIEETLLLEAQRLDEEKRKEEEFIIQLAWSTYFDS